MQARAAQQATDVVPVCVIRKIAGLAEVKNGQFVFEEIRGVARKFFECGVNIRRIGGPQKGLNDLERCALELNR